MHARIGAPRSVQLELVAPRRPLDGPLDLTRNRSRVLLYLPTAVFRSGVLDEEFKSRHGAQIDTTFAAAELVAPRASSPAVSQKIKSLEEQKGALGYSAACCRNCDDRLLLP